MGRPQMCAEQALFREKVNMVPLMAQVVARAHLDVTMAVARFAAVSGPL